MFETIWEKILLFFGNKYVKRAIIYIGFSIWAHFIIEEQHHSNFITAMLLISLLGIDSLVENMPSLTAYILVRKRVVSIAVVVVCFIFSYASIYISTENLKNNPFYILNDEQIRTFLDNVSVHGLLSFLMQGILFGFIVRLLFIQYVYKLVFAKDIFVTRLLILFVFIVLLYIFPFGHNHFYFASFFFFGATIGFLIHYFMRKKEWTNAMHARLKENLLSHLREIEHTDYLWEDETNAITYYAELNRRKLNDLLIKRQKNMTAVLFIVELSMLRKDSEYEKAYKKIIEMEDLMASDKAPEWFEKNIHFFRLHKALNLNDMGKSNDDIEKILEDALEKRNDCLLANATLALVIANKIDINTPNEERQKKAQDYVWKAMKMYEGKYNEINGVITGTTVSFTYSFLLDTYGYVLFKTCMSKFSRAIFSKCIHIDPSFSPPFLHQAEWYIEWKKNDQKRRNTNAQNNIEEKGRNNASKELSENWLNAAKLNLHIVIENEKLYDKKNQGSFVSNKAKQILKNL